MISPEKSERFPGLWSWKFIEFLRVWKSRRGDFVKVALWWATMNNIPYDYLQLLRFPIAAGCIGRLFLFTRNLFNSKKRLICSELITDGFYKLGYNLFNRPIEDIVPADFDNSTLFNVIEDVWML